MKQRKITPHTIFIYAWGNFLRIVRGEHKPPDVATKPRIYDNLKEALEGEHKSRILADLRRFPSDREIDRRLKAMAAPIKVKAHRTLASAIRSPLFTYAQVGHDLKHQEIVYVYHRDPGSHTGVQRVGQGRPLVVRKLLKKYKRPPMRAWDYEERKPKIAQEKRA